MLFALALTEVNMVTSLGEEKQFFPFRFFFTPFQIT